MTPEADHRRDQEVRPARARRRGLSPPAASGNRTRKAQGDVKYVVANGDEGDPGAFMDRSLMEGDPHAVLEGMIIGAYAIGAHQGFIYVRDEYPLAVKNLQHRASSRRASMACWARISWAPASTSTSRSCAAPARSSAASRPR